MAPARPIRIRMVRVRTLAVVSLVGGLICWFAAELPARPDAPVHLFRLIGSLGLIGSAVLWRWGDRTPEWFLQTGVALNTLGISILIARSPSAVGAVVASCAYVWISVYAAFFLARMAARTQLALMPVAFGAALLANPVSIPFGAWLVVTASLVLTEETIGRQSERLRHEANTDPLTGLLNRKGLRPAADRAFSLADKTLIPLTVALIDLDHFKLVNDREGHHAGDQLLVRLAESWRGELEPSDIFARLGGDEFVLLLLGSEADHGRRLMERLRFISPASWSAGIVARRPGEDLGGCLRRADEALYETKHSRREERRVSVGAG
jgi:diguanylate cyclase (GGDEF)-like protein